MSYSGGISINYTGARVEDVILNKANIDSDKDVLAGSYSIELMQEIKTELTTTITTLQAQVDAYETRIAYLEEQLMYLTTPP
jgi:hypothetical protein